MKKIILSLLLIVIFVPQLSYCQIKISNIFASNMVLPRDKAIPIKGKAQANETLEITINNQIHKIETDAQGDFKVVLKPMSFGGPFTLSFKGKDSQLILDNILVGDLWLCAGQSNMQYTLKMIDYKEIDSARTRFPKLRLGSVGIATDYLPKKDLDVVYWQEGTIENAQNFSATAYFFGRYLTENQKIPIGLISSNLGATTIETWMSIDALKEFPQFDEVTNDITTTNKDFATINKELIAFRETWDDKYYLKGSGMDEKWYSDDFDYSNWETCKLPSFWEDLGYKDHDGSFWFRKTFDLDSTQINQDFRISLNQMDDYDITWVNGQKVGETFGNSNFRNYVVPKEILRTKNNTLTVRVFDVGGKGGIYTHEFWGNKILNGNWKYKKGRSIDASQFPIPRVVNGSLFSYPSLLYNGGIAPLHDLPITGVIWYQGESNEHRAVEYEYLLKSMIKDWRKKWHNNTMPFLIVQLANYKAEDLLPTDNNWAELRASQMNATRLNNVDIMTAIDIGNGNDIHPRNKMEVGRRLGLLAMHYSYKAPLKKGPSYVSHIIKDYKIFIKMNTYGSKLKSLDKYGYLRGFAIAGEDGKFHWAKAYITKENEIVVYSKNVNNPKFVRYAWSSNPERLDLTNEEDLPAFPFRTDDFELSTAKIKYILNPHKF